MIRGLDGALAFRRPDGAPLQAAPAAPFDQPELQDATPRVTGKLPTWDGTRFDLPWAIDVLYRGCAKAKICPRVGWAWV